MVRRVRSCVVMPRSIAALVAVAAISLTGCAKSATPGSTSSEAPSLPSSMTTTDAPTGTARTQAAPGSVAARDSSFGTVPPNAWANETAKQPSTVLYLRGNAAVSSVYPTFSVISTPMKEAPAVKEIVQQGVIAQRQKGATVSPAADRQVGGLAASGYTLTRAQDTHQLKQTQYYVARGNTVYVITMTSAPSDASVTPALNGLLDNWSWGAAAAAQAPSGSPQTGGTMPSAATPPPSAS